MSNWDALVEGENLEAAKRERRKEFEEERIKRINLPGYEEDGWSLYSEYKDQKYVKVRKPLNPGLQFENRIWMLFYSMGYKVMNKDRLFDLSYDKKNPAITHQVDVFAADEETVLVIECKAAQKPGTRFDFKETIESILGCRQGMIEEIKKKFGRSIKIKFIFATHNYVLGDKNKELLASKSIEYFDDETVDYYAGLTQHLGATAKYQLLGKLFANSKIENMNDAVPALRGRMGGHRYYSFVIEPERLLKIGYVLHRSDANRNMMPTYQRVIKKSRLNQVREFVDDGGYFPNSVIISIDAPKGGLAFDIKQADTDSIAQLGILHLPKKYCSAYIIDGQHRLYGYSDTKYAKTNTIPVVAFENLDKEEQIKLFMDINENQKAVPKNLRNTLSADLLWTSSSLIERRKALRLRVAEYLGEEQASPLYGHVLIGENKKSSVRCVTMDTIERGIKSGSFLTTFDKNNHAINLGLFDNSDSCNDYAFELLTRYLVEAFGYFKKELPNSWEQGETDGGILTNNTGIYALLHIFSDVLEFLQKETGVIVKEKSALGLVELAEPLFACIVDFYKNMSPELSSEIKTQYGGKGPTQHWRYLQKSIHDQIAAFNPFGLEDWWADNSKQYNEVSSLMVERISERIISLVKAFMEENDVPFTYAYQCRLIKEKKDLKDRGLPLPDDWDLFTLKDCFDLANEGRLWSDGLKDIFTRPESQGRKGGTKAERIKWLEDISKIKNSLSRPGYSVKRADYEYICSIYNWLVPQESALDVDSN